MAAGLATVALSVTAWYATSAPRSAPRSASRTAGTTSAAARVVPGPSAVTSEASTTAPTASRQPVFFGLDVPDSSPQTAAGIAASVGVAPTVASLFIKLDSSFTAASLTRIAGPGVTPFITLEPWFTGMRSPAVHEPRFTLASITDGSHDDELTVIAHKIADYGHPVYLRFAHEMNGNWYPWAVTVNGNRPADYPAAWRHVHTLFQPITGGQVHWVFAPAAVQSVSPSAPTIAELYPGDAYVDYLGLSGYNHGSATAAQTLAPTIDRLAAVSARPVILAEIGSSGPDKAQWLTTLPGLIASYPQIRGFIYFSTSPATTGASGDYRIDSDPRTTAAFRTLVHTVPLSSTGAPGS